MFYILYGKTTLEQLLLLFINNLHYITNLQK